ncbi:MAG: LptF/LptG family permease [Alphaproteobacteria bacterium]|nr:LptF/LptG family permease [Alphaproteobacteria bacterium]
MTLPQRYILGALVKTVVAVVVIVVAVACITRSLVFLDYIVNRGMSVSIYLYIMLLTMPMLLFGLLPLAGFASVLFIYHKLSIDNELVVLRSAGMSNAALATPAIIVAGATTMLCLSMSAYFMPRSFGEFKDIEFFLKHRVASLIVKEGEFSRLGAKVTIYVRERKRSGELIGVLVQDDRDPERSKTVTAESALLSRVGDVNKVLLKQGNMQEFERRTGRLSVVYFDQHVTEIDMRESGPARIRERGMAERGILELLNPPTETPRDRELVGRSLAEGNQRIALPLLCLTYVAIALATLLIGPYDRRGARVRILVACGVVVIVQALNLLLASAASKATILLPAIHLNTLLPGLACAVLLAYCDRRLPRGQLLGRLQRHATVSLPGWRGTAPSMRDGGVG